MKSLPEICAANRAPTSNGVPEHVPTPKCIHSVTSKAGAFECTRCGVRWPAGTKWGEIVSGLLEEKFCVPMDDQVTDIVVAFLRSMVKICHPTAAPSLVDLNARLLAKRAEAKLDR